MRQLSLLYVQASLILGSIVSSCASPEVIGHDGYRAVEVYGGLGSFTDDLVLGEGKSTIGVGVRGLYRLEVEALGDESSSNDDLRGTVAIVGLGGAFGRIGEATASYDQVEAGLRHYFGSWFSAVQPYVGLSGVIRYSSLDADGLDDASELHAGLLTTIGIETPLSEDMRVGLGFQASTDMDIDVLGVGPVDVADNQVYLSITWLF